MTTRAEPQSGQEPTKARRSLIDEARRHQHRRRQMIGVIMMTPIAIGGLIVGLNLGGAGSQGDVATHPSSPPSRAQTPQAVGKNPPTGSPSSVVLPGPNAGDAIAASRSTASAAALQAAALQAVRGAVAAQSAKVTEGGQLEQVVQAQEAAESAQAAAAAAAAQPGRH